MIIPSHTPSNMRIYSNDDNAPSCNMEPKTLFLNSDNSNEKAINIFNKNTGIKQSIIPLIRRDKEPNNENFSSTFQTDCKNVLIEDFDIKNTEIENNLIKRNKYHDLIFQRSSNKPIKIHMKTILNQIYPNEYQPCFITSDHNQVEIITPNISLNSIIKPPKVTTPNIKIYPQNIIDADSQILMQQKKQMQQILLVKENSAPTPELIININNKNTVNKDYKPIKPRQNFTEDQRSILNSYLQAHSNNPYAGSKDVARLVEITGLQPRQIRTYFTNKRMRDAKCMNLVTAKRCRSIT